MNLPTKVCLGAGAFLIMSGGLLAVTGAALGGSSRPDLPFGGGSSSEYAGETYDYVDAEDLLPFTSLEVDVAVGDVTVMALGEYDLSISGARAGLITYEVVGDTLRVTDGEEGMPEAFSSGDETWVSIYLPDDVALETVDIHTAIGRVDLMDFAADSLTVTAGLGDVYMDDVKAADAGITLSMGDLSAYDIAASSSLTVRNELGDVWMDGDFQGDADFTMSLGDLDLRTEQSLSAYSLDIEASLGDLSLDGSTQYGAVRREGGPNSLTVDSEIGDVSVYFDYTY